MQEKLKRSLATTERDLNAILRILEWLKREEYQLKLDQLNFTAIIPDLTIPAAITIDQFQNEEHPGEALWIARSKAEKEMNEAEKKVEILMSNYLGSLNVSLETEVNYLKSFVNLAKFIYLEKTQYFSKKRGYEDHHKNIPGRLHHGCIAGVQAIPRCNTGQCGHTVQLIQQRQ